jgi:hypothetical protein
MTNANTTDVQLTFDNSKATLAGFAMKTNIPAVIIAAPIYVTISAANGLTSEGIDFMQML